MSMGTTDGSSPMERALWDYASQLERIREENRCIWESVFKEERL
jgi:hypothetical protein